MPLFRACGLVALFSLPLLAACHSGLLPVERPLDADPAPNAPSCPREEAAPSRPDAVVAEPSRSIGLRGSLDLAPSLRARARGGETVYVMAREAASQRMVAVTRLFVPKQAEAWPLTFWLEDDRLTTGVALSLSARIDQDGDATTKGPGDLVGTLGREVQLPQSTVHLVIDTAL